MTASGRGGPGHLVRRFFGSLSDRPPDRAAEDEVRRMLTAPEWWMWSAMAGRDRRHSLEVLVRFDADGPPAPRHARAAVLLHDAGKACTGLGVSMRVVATIVGPRGGRFSRYHDHEAIGARAARELGVDADVRELLERRGDAAILDRLDRADDL